MERVAGTVDARGIGVDFDSDVVSKVGVAKGLPSWQQVVSHIDKFSLHLGLDSFVDPDCVDGIATGAEHLKAGLGFKAVACGNNPVLGGDLGQTQNPATPVLYMGSAPA